MFPGVLAEAPVPAKCAEGRATHRQRSLPVLPVLVLQLNGDGHAGEEGNERLPV